MLLFTLLLLTSEALGSVRSLPAIETRLFNDNPIVDLGYAVHRAAINKTGKYLAFSDIRYAAPPIGNLRFAAPMAPTKTDRNIKDPGGQTSCYQAHSGPDIAAYNGKEFTGDPKDLIPPGSNETEDCLFLDVYVPSAVFQKKTRKAAVLVWIHGGGYYEGSKNPFNPAGLISQSQVNGGEGIIFVALNYRLALFGFLSGPTFQVNGTANAGLLDQRFALEWVQKYIDRFGGDTNRVTLMGESAGGGSVMHQITAYGGLKGKVPFQQAIPQSASMIPLISANAQETYYNLALSTASTIAGTPITSLEQLRALPANVLQTANALVIGFTAYAANPFGPAVDGVFAPALQSHLYLHGQYDHSLKVMVGRNSREGFVFTPPIPDVPGYAEGIISQLLPQASKEVIDTILNDLYPPVFDGSEGYKTQFERLEKANAEGYYNCNARLIAKGSFRSAYAYYVTLPPGYHGVDVPYTFFNGDVTTLKNGYPVNGPIAKKFQLYLTNFVANGDPNGKGLPQFPQYGSDASVFTVGITDFAKVQKDDAANERCDFWSKALWY